MASEFLDVDGLRRIGTRNAVLASCIATPSFIHCLPLDGDDLCAHPFVERIGLSRLIKHSVWDWYGVHCFWGRYYYLGCRGARLTAFELMLCVIAVIASSASQLCIKVASGQITTITGLCALGAAGALMLFSMMVAIWVLRTIQLSQLVPFAAGAYILVPLGSYLIIGEHIMPRFWLGVASITIGIYLTVL